MQHRKNAIVASLADSLHFDGFISQLTNAAIKNIAIKTVINNTNTM